jgi:PleD family two-component response regulator
VATTGARRESVEDILGRADEAMYDAKRQGKGRYVLARAA